MKKVVLIGAGRLAWHLGPALKKAGYTIIQVLGRDPENTFELAQNLDAEAILDWGKIDPESDFYFLALPDQVLWNISSLISLRNRFFIHCSGGSPIQAISGLGNSLGVLYPLQTFSKEIELDFSRIPLCLESSSPELGKILNTLAQSLSEFVYEMNSEKRAILHLSAVFANNFTNHLIGIAENIVEKEEISVQILFPLIAETVRKVFILGPQKSQTGPALRNDTQTQNRHLELLASDPELQRIYKDLSLDIYKKNNHGS